MDRTGPIANVVGIALREPAKAHTVETEQPFIRADPQIPIVRLGDCGNGSLRKTLLAAPMFMEILREQTRVVASARGYGQCSIAQAHSTHI